MRGDRSEVDESILVHRISAILSSGSGQSSAIPEDEALIVPGAFLQDLPSVSDLDSIVSDVFQDVIGRRLQFGFGCACPAF